jgi:hypothetical protein
LVFRYRRVIQRPNQSAFGAEKSKQALVIDVESERFGGCVKVCPIDEDRQPFIRIEMHHDKPFFQRTQNPLEITA